MTLLERASMQSVEVRQSLVETLRLDLVGPGERVGSGDRVLGTLDEILPQRPSAWYLTGFLIPIDADPEQKADPQAVDELDQANDSQGTDDAVPPEPAAAPVRYLPSSIGLSLLVAEKARELVAVIRWGDYVLQKRDDAQPAAVWVRRQREESVTIPIPARTEQPLTLPVPKSDGLELSVTVRQVQTPIVDGGLPAGTRSVSVFLVNRRKPQPDDSRDVAFAFQAQLEIRSDVSLVARPNLRSLESDDWDEAVADLQYCDVFEFSVGHNVATEALSEGTRCRSVRTCWIPEAEVERVASGEIAGVTLAMDELAQLNDAAEAASALGSLATRYREWIALQRSKIPGSPQCRKETAGELLRRAEVAAARIEAGVALLGDSTVLEAFRIANRVMARAARQRQGAMRGKDPAGIMPQWRPFQLAFILMNLRGIVHPEDDDREFVDLLFFPTGGGKTEAYLGLAAFTLVLRRLRNSGIASAGVSILMRYTLRLLTLDQLGRASTLICALELERQRDAAKLGDWPFEIGLWVGKAATPNVMGAKGDGIPDSARARTIAYGNDDRKPSPIPLEDCPWCGTKFGQKSFALLPNANNPTDLRVVCLNRKCAFDGNNPLPLLTVDEPIYRRLPCFLIATIDKFAAMPWTGEVGQFFGRVQRHDRHGFYGPCHPMQGQPLPVERLLPPDLIIQDELHLISGPLGTMAGLYETALDELCSRAQNGRTIRPKLVASTATVRWADRQIRALFGHTQVDIFPPPGPDRRDSFFAMTLPSTQTPARLYVGVAAQGRSPKVVMLRVYLALLTAAEKAWQAHDKKKDPGNPADPYMTLLGYFNSLRELGGARRVVEDEVVTQATTRASRKRVGEPGSLFANRKLAYEVVELTSRVSTAKVAEAKRLLGLPFCDADHVDAALATNMISVGLDITRLGLMVVFGQPKTSAEYIQATSRVGRDESKPGLIVTILNVHKPRDRSHYERFSVYHASFYRDVEVSSVTPFSPRALDRGLAGTLVALARQGHAPMTAPAGATEILRERGRLEFVVDALVRRAAGHDKLTSAELERLKHTVRQKSLDLLDEWSKIAQELQQVSGRLQYQKEVGAAQRLLYEFLSPELKVLPKRHRKFRANRSLRDVEPSVNLRLKHLSGADLEVEEDQP